jgi:predicted Fe-Mo cluster-binding NifX family protein
MKVAIASSGNGLESTVDSHTGRAACFIVYDTEQECFEVIDNLEACHCLHWTGTKTATILNNIGVGAIVTRRIGPSAYRQLTRLGIEIFFADESRVVDALRRFREGALERVTAPNCKGHEHDQH